MCLHTQLAFGRDMLIQYLTVIILRFSYFQCSQAKLICRQGPHLGQRHLAWRVFFFFLPAFVSFPIFFFSKNKKVESLNNNSFQEGRGGEILLKGRTSDDDDGRQTHTQETGACWTPCARRCRQVVQHAMPCCSCSRSLTAIRQPATGHHPLSTIFFFIKCCCISS